jgi:hypothetical protein
MTFVLLLLAALLSPLSALAVYRCEQQGHVTYTDFPCPGRELDIPRSPPPAQDSNDHLKRERSEVGRLQKLREQRERQDQQIRDLAARGAAAREKKCQSLALQVKWREEDVRDSTMDKSQKARTRLRRAQEKFEAECR